VPHEDLTPPEQTDIDMLETSSDFHDDLEPEIVQQVIDEDIKREHK
jgi:hypothetical protein